MFNTDVMFSACFHTQLAESLNAQLVDIEGLLCICLFCIYLSIHTFTKAHMLIRGSSNTLYLYLGHNRKHSLCCLWY